MIMPKTTPEQNKAIVLVAFDTLFNKRDYEAAERYWSPSYIQHMRLEWMWRLASDPKRLGARYLECMLLFAKLVWIATAKKRPHLGVRGPLPT